MRNTSKIIDLTGNKYGKLTVLGIASRNPLKWKCICDCGNTTEVGSSNLKRGQVTTCGCSHRRGNPTHGQCYTRVYKIYAKILRRCYKEYDPAYKNYGGRGITMCDEWRNSFVAFSEWAYSHGYSDDLSIDRIDNNKGYSPDNCRWATTYEQANNTRKNRVYTMNGETKTLSQWCRDYNAPYNRIHARLNAGWSFEEAITTKHDARLFKRRKDNSNA